MTQPHQVPAVKTPLTHEKAAEAFWFAHQAVIGGPCETLLLETLVIQWDVETGAGRAMWNDDMGNLRGHGPDGATMAIPGANEIIDGKLVTVEAGFASFDTPEQGAEAMIRLLGTASHPPKPNRFQGAWEAAKRGDLLEYARQLSEEVQGKGHAYFTANLQVYQRGLISRRDRARRGVSNFLATLTPTTPEAS